MKNILFLICLFVSTMLSAQNNVLTDIEKANAAYKTVEGAFTRTQTNAAKGTSETDKGTLYLAGDGQMAQHYQAPSSDVLIIHGDDFKYMKDGCMLSNSGHFNVEINRQDLEAQSVSCEEVRESIEMFTMKDGRKIYLLADGRLVNLAAARGQGHPAEIMDMSFAVQALSAKYIVENDLSLSVEKAPDSIDDDVARLKLKAMGIEIDDLSERQKDYLSDWREGT